MNDRPTTQQLDEIETRANAATAGPWTCSESGTVTAPLTVDDIADVWEPTHATRNAEFITAARTDVPALLDEVRRLRAELEAAQRLAADATAYQVHVPEGGGTTLMLRRQASAHGTGWAVSTMAPGGGRAWTTEGWQESISALSVDRLFCWPDPATAAAEARRALAAPAVSGAADSRQP